MLNAKITTAPVAVELIARVTEKKVLQSSARIRHADTFLAGRKTENSDDLLCLCKVYTHENAVGCIKEI
jgi:hypothetical protein